MSSSHRPSLRLSYIPRYDLHFISKNNNLTPLQVVLEARESPVTVTLGHPVVWPFSAGAHRRRPVLQIRRAHPLRHSHRDVFASSTVAIEPSYPCVSAHTSLAFADILRRNFTFFLLDVGISVLLSQMSASKPGI